MIPYRSHFAGRADLLAYIAWLRRWRGATR